MRKTANLTVKGGSHRVATPITGGLYSYHLYPMTVIFILVGFGPFFDSISFNILGRHERRKAASLGVANIITAMLIEDFTWFFYRWWLPHTGLFGNFVIPYWYVIAIIGAGVFYYYAFKRPK